MQSFFSHFTAVLAAWGLSFWGASAHARPLIRLKVELDFQDRTGAVYRMGSTRVVLDVLRAEGEGVFDADLRSGPYRIPTEVKRLEWWFQDKLFLASRSGRAVGYQWTLHRYEDLARLARQANHAWYRSESIQREAEAVIFSCDPAHRVEGSSCLISDWDFPEGQSIRDEEFRASASFFVKESRIETLFGSSHETQRHPQSKIRLRDPVSQTGVVLLISADRLTLD